LKAKPNNYVSNDLNYVSKPSEFVSIVDLTLS